MSVIRERREMAERAILAPGATAAERSLGRARPEPECDVRTCFQRDTDRIIHSKAFRRLMHKTQVFLQPEGDHYRTRLTHTLEVSRIARAITRALGFNEDLAEAIALGHDLGHTPFGHAGERALDVIMGPDGGFRHNEQSLRVTDVIEKDGRGLNLTAETRDGIVRHTGGAQPSTPEGRAVRLADRVAYVNHDTDDAIRAEILSESDIPEEITCALGDTYSKRIDTVIKDIIEESAKCGDIAMSPQISFAFNSFREFMFRRVYTDPRAKGEESKVFGILDALFRHYALHPGELPDEYGAIAQTDSPRRAACDYISGMTDKFAVYRYSQLFIPESWQPR
ncbi:MAG: deoxyguanosinetriphosphate triphosphohydrolase [Oscillospiraceae bacterium]|jgi:dGTPase|nr:deoxyguanosinetriphosphate triphosphohydrolase [Oscillospiraceae bacterium]